MRAVFITLFVLALGCGGSTPPGAARLSTDCAHAETQECLGATRVLPTLRARAEEGSPEAIATLGLWNDQASEPMLRELMRPGVGMDTRFAAAMALVDLGATDAPLAPFCTQLEGADEADRWQQCLAGLDRLDPSMALRYARDWASRNEQLTNAEQLRRASWAVEHMRSLGNTSDLARLVAWTEQVAPHREQPAAGRFLAVVQSARLRLGDPERAGWLTSPPSEHEEIFVAGLGAHVEDGPLLVRLAGRPAPVGTAAYDALDRLAPLLPPSPAHEETEQAEEIPDPRANLRAALSGISEARAYEGGDHHDPALLARHYATLVRLEDGAAAAALATMAEGEGPGAAEAVLQRLALGADGADGPILLALRRGDDIDRLDRAVEALGDDGRWAEALLNPALHQRATHHLARHRDARGVCEAVTEHAPEHLDAAQDALFVLTLLGDRCASAVSTLARNEPAIRDAALVTLGMMRASQLEALAAEYPHLPGTPMALDILHRPD
ncbi:MAG: hypothetical protein AB8I08_11000 [Sandaracinaceae bacterium]